MSDNTNQRVDPDRRQWINELDKAEKSSAQRLLSTYKRILLPNGAVTLAMNKLVERIGQFEEPSPQDIRDLEELQILLSNVNTELAVMVMKIKGYNP